MLEAVSFLMTLDIYRFSTWSRQNLNGPTRFPAFADALVPDHVYMFMYHDPLPMLLPNWAVSVVGNNKIENS